MSQDTARAHDKDRAAADAPLIESAEDRAVDQALDFASRQGRRAARAQTLASWAFIGWAVTLLAWAVSAAFRL